MEHVPYLNFDFPCFVWPMLEDFFLGGCQEWGYLALFFLNPARGKLFVFFSLADAKM